MMMVLFSLANTNADSRAIEHISKTKELSDEIQSYEDRGVFEENIAQIVNDKVYRFFYNQSKNLVQIDPELQLNLNYEFYAILQPDLNPRTYITGRRTDPNDTNSPISYLVDTNEVLDGTTPLYRTASAGNVLNGDLVDGQRYLVEFYNTIGENGDLRTVARIPFVCEFVINSNLSMTPDSSVVDLFILSNQNHNDRLDEVELKQYSNLSYLDINTYIRYADGSIRNVDVYENTNPVRLTKKLVSGSTESAFTGANVDTSVLTGGNPKIIRITYTLLTSSDGQANSGARLLYNGLKIRRDIKLHIVANNFSDIRNIIPIFWISNTTVLHRIYAIDDDNILFDATDLNGSTYNTGPSTYGTEQSLIARIRRISYLPTSGDSSFRVIVHPSVTTRMTTTTTPADNPAVPSQRTNANSYGIAIEATYDSSTNLMRLDYYTSLSTLVGDNTKNSIVPDRFVIKTLDGFPITQVGGVPISQYNSFGYTNNPDTQWSFTTSRPLIIEFIRGNSVAYARPLWLNVGTVS